MTAGRFGKLVPSEVWCAQSSPPVSASTHARHTRQVSSRVAATWIDHPDRDSAASLLHRPPDVTVVADHYGTVEAAGEHVNEQVRCNVDVASLLLVGGHTRYERGVSHCCPASLHGDWPSRPDYHGPALLVLSRERALDHLRDVVAIFDVVYAPGRQERFQVYVLISGATGTPRLASQRRCRGCCTGLLKLREAVPLLEQRFTS